MTVAGEKPRKIRPIGPIVFTVLVVAAGFFARNPIVDAVSGRSSSGFSLHTPFWYSALAPLSNVFDGLTLLSLPQVFSAFGFVCLIAIVLRFRAIGLRRRNDIPAFRARDHIRFAANVFGGIIAAAGLALLAPRPMAEFRMNNPDFVSVDFHSHTSASHDGRPEFTPEVNREWHRKAGFDAAYITDHHTFAGANAAMLANPRLSGEGMVLLPGLEYLDGDEHLLALGLDSKTTDPRRREWHPLFAGDSSAGKDAPTVLILALPGDVKATPAGEDAGIARLAAVELSDGSPRGIEQVAKDKSGVLALAKRKNLSLVAGSDNHGWGHAAVAWTVMRIPGWRTMPPARLDAAIRTALAESPVTATSVMTRRMPPAASALTVALTGPELAWEIARDIGWYERISWIFWIWAGWGLLLVAHRRRSARHVHIQWSLPEVVPGGSAEIVAVPD